MIDKYKPARVQRLVPWRNPPRRSNDPTAWAQRLAADIVARQRAALAAQVSCALPGEFTPQDLRSA